MAAPVVAILLLREKELIEHFRTHRALSHDTAVTREQLMVDDNTTFRRLRVRGVIREGERDRFYLDEQAIVLRQQSMRRIVIISVVVLAMLAVALVTLRSNGVAN